MSVKSLKLIPRGKVLLVAVDGATPISFVDWANEVAKPLGVSIECSNTPSQPGNYNVSLGADSWNGVPNFNRVAALVDITRALEAGGIPMATEDGQVVLNLATAGPPQEGTRGRSARMQLYINLSNLQAKTQTGGGTQVTVNGGEARFTDAMAAYLDAGLDYDAFITKFGTASTAIQTAALESAVKKHLAQQGTSSAPETETTDEGKVAM